MKKIKKSSEFLWLFGTIILALGVAICSKANLGVSMIAAPTFIFFELIEPYWSFLYVGTAEYIVQGVILIILCLVIRRFNWRYLLSFSFAVFYGYRLNLSLFFLDGVIFDAIWLRWVMLIVGDLLTAFGVACFFRTYMPPQVYELFVSEFSSRFKLSINKVKMVFDLSMLAISVILAFSLFGDAGSFDWSTIWYSSFHNLGLGTVVTTFINTPLIFLMGKLLDKIFDPTPMFPKLEKALRRQ